jgi:Gpi18-like mannosyltransferase
MPAEAPGDALLGVWVRWDAIHHLNLALRGYADVPVGDTVFYPLYPLLVRGLAGLFGGDVLLAALLISTLATWAAFAALYRLAEAWQGPATARWAVLSLAAFPTSFYLLAPYSESLFIALTIGAFLAAYEDHWWIAGALGLAASLTRGPGVLMAAL